MTQKRKFIIKGAGVAGLWAALFALRDGAEAEIYDPQPEERANACSYLSGGMLAPYCEREASDESVFAYGVESLDLWREYFPDLITMSGTLVLAAPKDYNRLRAFAAQTQGYEKVNAPRIAELEPDLAGRFAAGLYYPNEGFLEPRKALPALTDAVRKAGGVFHFGKYFDRKLYQESVNLYIIDCTGLAAKRERTDLRGVRGEILTVRCEEVTLSRPVRALHPRHPIYVIPRPDRRFTVGATSIENENASPFVTVRSAGEMLTRLFDLHSGFAEAEILEMTAGLRPAQFNNLPIVEKRNTGGNINNDAEYAINGLYRHGWMAAPALAKKLIIQIRRNTPL